MAQVWLDRTGEQPTRFEREVRLDCDGPPETWVTELQKVLRPQHEARSGDPR